MPHETPLIATIVVGLCLGGSGLGGNFFNFLGAGLLCCSFLLGSFCSRSGSHSSFVGFGRSGRSRLGCSFFSGASLFLLKCDGHGPLFFSSYGGIHAVDIGPAGYICDTGHVVAGRDLTATCAAILDDPSIGKIAAAHGKSPAQIILRWHLEQGHTVLSKSVTPARMRDNAAIFDFALDADESAAIAALNTDSRVGPDPVELN